MPVVWTPAQALRVLQKKPSSLAEENGVQDCTFYVSAVRSEKDENEYSSLCTRAGIPWGGVLEN